MDQGQTSLAAALDEAIGQMVAVADSGPALLPAGWGVRCVVHAETFRARSSGSNPRTTRQTVIQYDAKRGECSIRAARFGRRRAAPGRQFPSLPSAESAAGSSGGRPAMVIWRSIR